MDRAECVTHVLAHLLPMSPVRTITSVGPRILHYGTGQQCVVVENPLNPRRKVGGGQSKTKGQLRALGGDISIASLSVLSYQLTSVMSTIWFASDVTASCVAVANEWPSSGANSA